MSEEMTNGAPAPKTLNPFSKTLMLMLGIHLLGISRKVETRSEGVEIDVADADLVSVSKRLLKCDEYDAIKTRIGKLKSNLKKMSLPGGNRLFKGGTFAILKTRVLDAIAELDAAEKELPPLFDAFCAVYAKRRDETLAMLGPLGNLNDYPPPSKVRQAFGLDYEWIQIGISPDLQTIDPQVFGRELQKEQAKLRQASDEAMQALHVMLQEAIDGFANALKPGEDGKKKVIATPLKALKELLANFESVFEGTDLEVLSKKLQSVISNANPEVLRESPATRKVVERRMAEVKKSMDKLVGPLPERKFRSED